MAYGKLERFAKENEEVEMYLDQGLVFEAWIVYIREAPKEMETIVNDIDQEINTKKCPLSEGEKDSLQCEAMELLMYADDDAVAVY